MNDIQQLNDWWEDFKKLSESSPELSIKSIDDKPCVFRLEPHEICILQEPDGWHIRLLDDPILEEKLLNEIERHCGKRVFQYLSAAIDAANRFEPKTKPQQSLRNSIELPKEIVLKGDAYELIVRECSEHLNLKSECGGSLFGIRLDSQVIIKKAGQTGAAVKSYAHIRTDASSQSQQLQEARSIGLNYLGDWHLHPMSLHRLSVTDKNTINKILINESHLIPDGIFTAILVVAEKNQLVVHGFVVRQMNQQVEIKEVPVIIPNVYNKVLPVKQSIVSSLQKPIVQEVSSRRNLNILHLLSSRVFLFALGIILLIALSIFTLSRVNHRQMSVNSNDTIFNDNPQLEADSVHLIAKSYTRDEKLITSTNDNILKEGLHNGQEKGVSKDQPEKDKKANAESDTQSLSLGKMGIISMESPLQKTNEGKSDSLSTISDKNNQNSNASSDSKIVRWQDSTSSILIGIPSDIKDSSNSVINDPEGN